MKFDLQINDPVTKDDIEPPIVVTRVHFDAGSVTIPNRDIEIMKDRTNVVAARVILTAPINCAAGADIVSVHNNSG